MATTRGGRQLRSVSAGPQRPLGGEVFWVVRPSVRAADRVTAARV